VLRCDSIRISRTTTEIKSGRGAADGSHCPGPSRAKATISRELQRNALPSSGYSPHAAGSYQLRRRILKREAAFPSVRRDRLAEGWTPEQISGRMKSGNEPRLRAIHALIYRTGQKAEALWRRLTRRHKRSPVSPQSVARLHEPKSRVTVARGSQGKPPRKPSCARGARSHRSSFARSITFDNDTAFAQHGLLRTMRNITPWFCDACGSSQKGGVENANGRSLQMAAAPPR
jgi:transposase, IS30 family